LFALVHPQVGQDEVDRRDRRRNFTVHLLQERDELRLSLAAGRLSVNLARAGVEGREQVQRPATTIFVFGTGSNGRSEV
jgi:hypothetical protein